MNVKKSRLFNKFTCLNVSTEADSRNVIYMLIIEGCRQKQNKTPQMFIRDFLNFGHS